MPDPNVIRQALRVRLQENARFIREKAKRYPEQSNAEVASKLESLAAQLEDRRLGALALLLETLEKALQPKKAFDECPIESGLLCLLATFKNINPSPSAREFFAQSRSGRFVRPKSNKEAPIFIDSKLPHDLSDHSAEAQAPRQLFS